MEKFIVEGGNQLSGEFTPAGNKNEALPVIAATLLTEQKVTLSNLPNIGDIRSMHSLLLSLGADSNWTDEHTLEVSSENLNSFTPDQKISEKIRGSFLFAAPLLHRFQKVEIFIPGGDSIGRRRLDTHFLVFQKLGAEVERKTHSYIISAKKLVGSFILLDEASVTATENALMAAVLAEGKTTIYNAACEPHVQGLCNMLIQMGADIKGVGSNCIEINGVSSLNGVNYEVQPDHTEVGSIIGLSVVTNSEITIKRAGTNHGLMPFFFQKLGVQIEFEGENIRVPKDQDLIIQNDDGDSLTKIDDSPWPGFPADLTSIMTVVATQCKGTILIFEKLFESRLFWVDKLISMGAKIVLCDPHRAVIVGPSKLNGMTLNSPDIRAGMALLIAALCARGESQIYNISQIDRGYENIDLRLNALGAKIKRVSE